ncbi:MAG: histidine phosphatase family protein [Acidimicrobiales bacterium]
MSTVPAGVRMTGAGDVAATRVVLVRHGEAACNVEGVVGGRRGCTGLTHRGAAQVAALARRLARTGELAGVAALYASRLPRAIETATMLAPALDCWRDGPALEVMTDCGLCELHPGEADGLRWEELATRFGEPDWDVDPAHPLSPGGESWSSFVDRAAAAVEGVADAHRRGLVVVACHAGVVEATMLRFLGVGPVRRRLGLRTRHASLTVWARGEGEWGTGTWLLERYNDVATED